MSTDRASYQRALAKLASLGARGKPLDAPRLWIATTEVG